MCFHFCKKEEKLGELKKQKEEIYKELDELYLDSKINTLNYFAGCAFVTFSSLKEQELFLKNFNYTIFQKFIKFFKDLIYMICGCCIDKNKKPIIWLRRFVNFEQADEPSDIIFENLAFGIISKNLRTFIVYIISFFIAIFSNSICFVIIASINALLDYINKKYPHPIVQYLTSLVISCISTALNYIYENIFHILTKFEKQSTMTKYYLSYSIKLTIFSFVNSGILPLLGEIYHPSDCHKTLINNMLMIFLLNSIYTPIRWTLNISFFRKKINICLLERTKEPDEEHGKTQKELNDLYELPNMNISIKYSYVAKTLLMAFLYIPIFPFGIVISFFGFCLAFLLEKFNFSKIYKKPEMLGAKICKFYVDYFIIVLFVYALGDYFFLRDIYRTSFWSFFNLITFGFFIFVPYVKLLNRDYLNFDKYDFYKKEYKDCFEFSQDYERANPISKKEGKINYLKKLKEKELINENEYIDYIKDIYNVNIMQIYYKNKNKIKDKIEDEDKDKYEEKNKDKDKYEDKNKDEDKIKKIIKKFIDENINSNNNGSFTVNINKNMRKKKKKKSLISKPLTLNHINSINSNNNINNNNINFADSSNQNYLWIY